MSQSHHGKVQERDNSCMSGKAASARNYKFPTSHERHFPIPHKWLSRRGEITIPHERRSREWGIVILPQLLSHEWGIGKCLEWRVGNLPVPVPFHDGIYIPIQPGKTLTNCIEINLENSLILKKHHVINSIQLPQWNLQSSIKPIPSP